MATGFQVLQQMVVLSGCLDMCGSHVSDELCGDNLHYDIHRGALYLPTFEETR